MSTTHSNEKFRKQTKGSIIRVHKQKQYTVLDNTAANDERLSFKAVGIHTYLMTKTDSWAVYANDLAKRHTDGRDSVLSGLRELEECGYLIRRTVRDEQGRIIGRESIVFEVPHEEVTVNGETRITAKPSYGKPATSKYCSSVNTEEKKKDMSSGDDAPASQDPQASETANQPSPSSQDELTQPSGSNQVSQATSTEDVPPPPRETNHRREQAQRLVDIWNEHCGALPKVKKLTTARVTKLATLRKELGDETEALFADATRCVAADDYWHKKKYGFGNLLRMVVEKAEKWQAQQDEAPASGPLRRRRY